MFDFALQISQATGLPSCECDPGYAGAECERRIDACKSFCFNGGSCSYAEDMTPFCSCPPEFMGKQFFLLVIFLMTLKKVPEKGTAYGNLVLYERYASFIFVVKWGQHEADMLILNKPLSLLNLSAFCLGYVMCCNCRHAFLGRRCENCVLENGEMHLCRNGGYCKGRKGCSCPPGYTGVSCEKDLCLGNHFNVCAFHV